MASVGVTAEELANALYDSLREKILPLPDETLVYPAHGAGSMCGRNLSSETVSTIGVQRQYNYALQPMSRGQFVALVTADQPEAPAYFGYDAMLNRRERDTLETVLGRELRPLSLEEALAAESGGALLLDVRDGADFEGAHIRGALNIGLDGQFASWAGTLIDHARPIVVVADPGREVEAATRLGRIGFDHVLGFLDGGMGAVGAREDLLARGERITAATVLEQRGGGDPPVVVDVRNANEREAGRVAGSLHIPLNHLAQRAGEIPAGRPVVIHCQGGYRSATALSMLERAGLQGAADMVGGFGAWEAAGLPAETGPERERVAAGPPLS
jgi:rhodanese-related sulfurtransferase